MKSKIKFDVNISQNSANFSEVKVILDNETFKTTLFTKPTNSHLNLNYNSCHPSLVIRSIPKGQFIRVRQNDYVNHSIETKHFVERGHDEKGLGNSIKNILVWNEENA